MTLGRSVHRVNLDNARLPNSDNIEWKTAPLTNIEIKFSVFEQLIKPTKHWSSNYGAWSSVAKYCNEEVVVFLRNDFSRR